MNIEEYIKRKHRNDINNQNNKVKYLKNLVTRVLLSLILVILVSIFIKMDGENKSIVNRYFFEDNLKFTKINNLYQKYIGNVIPEVKEPTTLVFSSSDLKKFEYEEYYDGVKISTKKNEPISALYGGIVVFIGNKEDYGNTLIIQGNDGIDYWYSGIQNYSVNLYDYIEKDTLIGETKEN